MYAAFLRPNAVYTSLVTGVAWMDTKLLKATLYEGSSIPGTGQQWANEAPLAGSALDTLTAAFNSGFRMQDAQGGYYADGVTAIPLVAGGGVPGHQQRRHPPDRLVGQRRDDVPVRGGGAPEPRPHRRPRQPGARPRCQRQHAAGGRPSVAPSTCGGRASGSPPTGHWSMPVARACPSSIWPTCWPGPAPCGPWRWTSTLRGSTSSATTLPRPAGRTVRRHEAHRRRGQLAGALLLPVRPRLHHDVDAAGPVRRRLGRAVAGPAGPGSARGRRADGALISRASCARRPEAAAA